jgi:hypothetical protein
MSDIVFVTTTLYTKWLDYQSKIIKDLFPDSEHIIVDGRSSWPNSWFNWIDLAKKSNSKYYIHIDEDFFITNKDEVIRCIEKIESEDIDLLGCSDGYHHYRQHNPVAINTFFMVGKVESLKDLDFSVIKFQWVGDSYINNMNLHYKEDYSNGFEYKHEKFAGCKFDNFEPYYAFLWKMKEMGLKFDYLYPHFDDRFKSTNPRIDKDSEDIGIHMWYTRQWNSDMIVSGVSNISRYIELEKYLNTMSLQEIGYKYQTDKATHHRFCDVYDRYLSNIKNEKLVFLEIGILNGSSIKMWEEYLPNSLIYGADLYDKSFLNSERIKTFILNQEKDDDLNKIDIKFDVIIDDGGHTMLQQQKTLNIMINKMKSNGIYILEDLHTSLLEEKHGYGNTKTNNTLNLIKDLKTGNLSSNDYFINEYDFNRILSKIKYIEIYETKPGSITSIIIIK